jgi:hypothetical protein
MQCFFHLSITKKRLTNLPSRNFFNLEKMLIYEPRFFYVTKSLASSSCKQQLVMSGEGWKTLIKCPQPRTDANTFFGEL